MLHKCAIKLYLVTLVILVSNHRHHIIGAEHGMMPLLLNYFSDV